MSLDRTRTIRWENPAKTMARTLGLAGADYLRDVARGALPEPPFVALLGFDTLEVSEGTVSIGFVPAEYHHGATATVALGLTGALCDAAMACAVHSLLPAGTGYRALEFKVNSVRPISRNIGRLRCIGSAVHVGRTTATALARVMDASGELYALAMGTFLVLPGSAASGRQVGG